MFRCIGRVFDDPRGVGNLLDDDVAIVAAFAGLTGAFACLAGVESYRTNRPVAVDASLPMDSPAPCAGAVWLRAARVAGIAIAR